MARLRADRTGAEFSASVNHCGGGGPSSTVTVRLLIDDDPGIHRMNRPSAATSTSRPTAAIPVRRSFQVSLICVNGTAELVVPVTKTTAVAVMLTVLAGLAT